MTPSLYDLSVPTFLQTVRAVGGFLDRTARHCAEAGIDPDDDRLRHSAHARRAARQARL